ncbi:hypothetical protein ACVNP1_04130 [Staphylococcus aureus]
MNYTQQLKQKDSEYVWHPFTQMGVYSKEEAIIIEKERVVTFTIRMAIIFRWLCIVVNVHGHNNKYLNKVIKQTQ